MLRFAQHDSPLVATRSRTVRRFYRALTKNTTLRPRRQHRFTSVWMTGMDNGLYILKATRQIAAKRGHLDGSGRRM